MQDFQSHIEPSDMVFNNEDGNIMSNGYLIDNIFLNSNQSALNTNNSKIHGGGSISSIFKDLAVPTGLLYLQQKPTNHYRSSTFGENEVVDDTLYDKLLKLIEPDDIKKKQPTKKRKKSKNNKTKRNNK